MKKVRTHLVFSLFFAVVLFFSACSTEHTTPDPLSIFKHSFISEVKVSENGLTFLAELSADAAEADNTLRGFHLTVKSPETLSGLHAHLDGASEKLTISLGDICFEHDYSAEAPCLPCGIALMFNDTITVTKFCTDGVYADLSSGHKAFFKLANDGTPLSFELKNDAGELVSCVEFISFIVSQ